MRALLISLGAGIGAPLRYLVDKYLRKSKKSLLPMETLLINVLGSFVLGLTIHRSANLGYLAGTGFAGAFTTWSTFAVESHELVRASKHLTAWLYLALTLVLGIGAASLGISL
jgi:CrcB protein